MLKIFLSFVMLSVLVNTKGKVSSTFTNQPISNTIELSEQVADSMDNSELSEARKIINEGIKISQPDSVFYNAQLKYDSAKSKGLKKQMAEALLIQGTSLLNQKDYAKSLDYNLRSLSIWEEIGDKARISESLNKIGIAYYCLLDYTNANKYFVRNTVLAEEIGNKQNLVDALYYSGLIYYAEGNSSKAINNYLLNLKLNEEIGDKNATVTTLNMIATAYLYLGNYAKCIVYHTRNLTFSENIGNKWGIAKSLIGIGNVYNSQGKYVMALDQYTRSLTNLEEIEDKSVIASALINIGGIYKKKGNHSIAMNYFNRSLVVLEENGQTNGIAHVLILKGDIYYDQKDYVKALNYYTRALAIKEEVKNKKGIATSLYKIGNVYKQQSDYARSIAFTTRALKLAQEIDDAIEIRNAANALYNVYKASGENELALEMYEYYIATRDSLDREENQREVIRQEYKYTYEKQAVVDSIAYAQKQKVSEAKLEKSRTQQFALFIGLILFIGFSGLMYTLKRKLYHSSLLLKGQNKEIKALNDAKDQFLSIVSHDLRGPIANINGFSELMADNIDLKEYDSLKKSTSIINKQSLVLLDSLNQLEVWIKTQRTTLAVNLTFQDLSDTVVSVRRFLDLQLKEKQVHFTNEVDRNHKAFFDKSMIEIVLRNLIANAIKFTEEKGRISVSSIIDLKYVTIEIKDSGIGMDNDQIQKLFDPANYESSPGTNMERGTGLGLKICKEFIERNKGTVWVKSEVGKGSSFYFTLPVNTK